MSDHPDRAFFPKEERLSKKRAFAHLFEHGSSFRVGVLSCFYTFDPPADLVTASASVAIAVPKRKIRLAVRRNIVKRRIREAYRQAKAPLLHTLQQNGHTLIFLFIYQPRQDLPYRVVEKAVIQAIRKLERLIPPNSAENPVP